MMSNTKEENLNKWWASLLELHLIVIKEKRESHKAFLILPQI